MQSINIHMKKYIFGALFIIIFSACNHDKQDQKQLQDSVMKVHDDLMMKMDAIMTNKMSLAKVQSHLDSLKKADPSLDTIVIKNKIESLKNNLTTADDGMMVWMNNFNPDYTGKSHEEIIIYLQEQKMKIDSVATKISSSLKESTSFISKFK